MITIYAKNKKTTDGKLFKIYLTTVTMHGNPVRVRVKFTESAPKSFPVNIEVNRETANLQEIRYTKDGQERKTFTLWVTQWELSTEEYRNHSLDNVEL